MKPDTPMTGRAAPASPDQVAMREAEAYLRTQAPADIAAMEWHGLCEQGLSAADDVRFRQWLAADAAHQLAFSRIDESLRQVRALPAERTAHLRRARPIPVPRRRALAVLGAWLATMSLRPAAVALCCAVLVAAGAGGWQWWRQPLFEQSYTAQRGQRLDIGLPDGSRLMLDTGTRVEVTLYRDRRLVRLAQGQAMFSVARDAARPFTVLAGPARVTVLGTRFAVRCRDCDGNGDGDAAEVEVEEGRVAVARSDSAGGGGGDGGSGGGGSGGNGGATGAGAVPLPAVTQLHGGQAIRVSATGLGTVAAIDPSSVAPWRKGLIRFSSTPLAEALREFERYAPLNLVVRDPEVARMRVGGSYRSADPSAFAQALPHILPVRLLRRDDGTTEVVRKN